MKKVIFLDIDGVLNVCYNGMDKYGQEFHPHLVENLKWIIEETGAKIVISSSWRKNGLQEMKDMWKDRNLPGEVIDTTCALYLQKGGSIQFFNDKLSEHPTPKISGYSIPRGCEIEYWMKDNYVDRYVILDDDSDFLYCQRHNFVRTSGNKSHHDCIDIGYGLTKKCADKAIKILNK